VSRGRREREEEKSDKGEGATYGGQAHLESPEREEEIDRKPPGPSVARGEVNEGFSRGAQCPLRISRKVEEIVHIMAYTARLGP
jgi:hypothetical protein